MGLDNIVKGRVKGTSIGFAADLATITPEQLADVTPDDLVRFGLIPEFVGRFPSWVALKELSKADMIRILKDIKHNYISQYHWLFVQDQVELNFTPESLELIAERTIKNKTGARGLHSELERVLLPHMFHLAQYRKQGITSVEIGIDQVNMPKELKQVNG